MPREVAQRILWEEGGDLKARWILTNLSERAFNSHHKAAAASLIHAAAYLENREAYAAAPWPKNMIRLPIGSGIPEDAR
jgi:hypothetical protein